MNIETIHEPVLVMAVFSAGEVNPVRFQWNGREHEIFAINGRWLDRQVSRSGGAGLWLKAYLPLNAHLQMSLLR